MTDPLKNPATPQPQQQNQQNPAQNPAQYPAISVITPEHTPANKAYLLELFDSLVAQTFQDWEWVVYLNGTCMPGDLAPAIATDPRVRVVCAADRTERRIGAIKHAAFMLGRGQVLVEADHDDMLTPDCLEELWEAYKDPEVGFVYSDSAVLRQDGKDFEPFNPEHGWRWREFEWRGRRLKAMHSFPPTSHSMAYIWYAPDHVRSWRASVYRELGGHDATLDVCDDHDLCIRTYLHTTMVHLPKVLYVYRITGDNTWLERNAAIQDLTKQLFHKYGQRLAERDAAKRGLTLVDLGGGLQPKPGYLVVDRRPTADIVADLDEGIPLPDNSVGVVHASHILEHLRDARKSMAEIHRVLAPGGWAFIEVPSTDGRGAFQDPTHVTFWNQNSFLYYTDRYLAQFIDNATTRFQEYRMETHFPNEWMKSLDVSVVSAWLVALKGTEGSPGNPPVARLPGTLKI